MQFKIIHNEDGGYEVETVEIDPPQKTRREQAEAYRAEKAQAREGASNRLIESQQALDITPEIDMRPVVEDGRTKCEHCDFMAVSDFGLRAHMRAKHKAE